MPLEQILTVANLYSRADHEEGQEAGEDECHDQPSDPVVPDTRALATLAPIAVDVAPSSHC